MNAPVAIPQTEWKPVVGRQFKVLVTDGDYPQTLGIVRSLGQKGFRVTTIGTSPRNLAARSRHCFGTEVAPQPEDDDFVEAVLKILHDSFDLLIPVGYAATESIARHRGEIERLTRLELADHEQIRLAANKRAICELAARVGVPVPQSIYPATWQDVARAKDQFCYPIIVKPLRESSGVTVRRLNSAHELPSRYREFCEQWDYSEGNLPMLQEYVPGYGCGFFALYRRGICERIFMHRRIRENPPTGGASACAESFYDERLKEYGMRILNELEWHGVAMVEFRYDVRVDDYKLLEVNPKFWGSLDLALAAGVDFPFYLCQMAQGLELQYSEDYRTNLRHHWPLSGEIAHVVQRPSALGAVLMDSFNPCVKSNVWISDLVPNLHEGLRVARSVCKRILKG